MVEYAEYTAHTPVLLKEVISYLEPKNGEKFLDCTFGAGGYSKAILESSLSTVIALDRDPNVKNFADMLKNQYHERFDFFQVNFANSYEFLKGQKFHGIVMDLGVSSMQLDEAIRGFSFMKNGPLDMRMDSAGFSATDFINNADEKEIANVIWKYGEEKQSKKIARKIVFERNIEPINTTIRLATIIRACKNFNNAKIDAATKTFQAIRIYINNELEYLEDFLAKVADLLLVGGRLVVVSFHSLEDSIVKTFLQCNSVKKVAMSKYAKQIIEENVEGKNFKILTKKPVFPSMQEIKLNPRSRSSRLRAAVKI